MTLPPLNMVFTITAGRTGTTYLYQLLRLNMPNCVAYHERTGQGVFFGIHCPEVSTMADFNYTGMTERVKSFWLVKLNLCMEELVANDRTHYIETSHILWKAGLVDASTFMKNPRINWHFIYLKRDFMKTLLSYYHRFDFYNSTNLWIWYLEPKYARNMVSYKPFAEYVDPKDREQVIWSIRLWYLHEVRARALAYRERYRDRPRYQIITVDVKDLNSEDNVHRLLKQLGGEVSESAIQMPGRKNVTKEKRPISSKDIKWLEEFVEAME